MRHMKTELATVEDLSGLTLDELKEMANTFGEKCQQAAKKTVQDAIAAGTALLAAKAKCPHGTWVKWLGENWDYSRRTAMTYMDLASNVKRFTFEEAGSIRQAIGMIAAEKSEAESAEVPRESRKPGRVAVVDQDDKDDDDDGSEIIDDDPTPDPPTIRKTAPGAGKVKEADKPKPRPIVPEVIPELTDRDPVADWLESHSMADIVAAAVASLHEDDRKAAAKALRKAADQLDPPEESPKPEKVPTIAQLIRAIPDEVNSLRGVIEKWARHKQSLQGKARVRSMESWQTMIEQMLKACDKHGVGEVSESIRSSIANGYTGWDIQLKTANGKANGNGHKNGSSSDDFIARNAAKLRATFGCD